MLLLCYFIIRVDTILVVGARHPVWKHTSLVLFFCLFSISRAGCSSVARKPLRSVRVNGVGSHEIGSGFNSRRRSHPRFNSLGIRSHPRFNSLGIRSHDLGAIHYFIPSLVALGRGIYISLMIRFLYYNCLGFDLVLWLQHNIIPNTV